MKRKEAEALLKATLDSEKLERQRIAADLHDGVSGDLNAIRIYLSILQKGEIDDEKKELLADIKEGIDTALENTRQVSYKLIPPLLELAGFIPALEDYFERLTAKSKVLFEVQCREEWVDLSSEVSYDLFRIVQEFTTNMLKYGHCTRCSVVLTSLVSSSSVEIIDDGVPYNFKALTSTAKGSGLKNIYSRLKSIGAEMEQREAEKGNHFVITIK